MVAPEYTCMTSFVGANKKITVITKGTEIQSIASNLAEGKKVSPTQKRKKKQRKKQHTELTN